MITIPTLNCIELFLIMKRMEKLHTSNLDYRSKYLIRPVHQGWSSV
jgi:hypothetical protein